MVIQRDIKEILSMWMTLHFQDVFTCHLARQVAAPASESPSDVLSVQKGQQWDEDLGCEAFTSFIKIWKSAQLLLSNEIFIDFSCDLCRLRYFSKCFYRFSRLIEVAWKYRLKPNHVQPACPKQWRSSREMLPRLRLRASLWCEKQARERRFDLGSPVMDNFKELYCTYSIYCVYIYM